MPNGCQILQQLLSILSNVVKLWEREYLDRNSGIIYWGIFAWSKFKFKVFSVADCSVVVLSSQSSIDGVYKALAVEKNE